MAELFFLLLKKGNCHKLLTEFIMKKCYVLFVKSGYEEIIVKRLKSILQINPFVPMKEYFFIRNGIVDKRKKICFRGYVFVESSLMPEEFICLFSKFNIRIKQIIKILNYGDYLDIAMREEELEGLIKMFGSNFCLDISKGLLIENKVRIISGTLIGMESRIKRVNLKKKEVALEMEIMGCKKEFWVGLDLIDKV